MHEGRLNIIYCIQIKCLEYGVETPKIIVSLVYIVDINFLHRWYYTKKKPLIYL